MWYVTEATMPTHVFSLSEAVAKEMHERQKENLLKHNQKFMMRIFPSGMRVDSSNLDPFSFWQQGAQMVALNWQNCDEGMMLNEAMFSDGGGWALKPKLLRDVLEGSPDSDANTNHIVSAADLSIKIFAGQEFQLPVGDSAKGFRPYVTCQLHLSQDERMIPKEHILASESEKGYKLRTKASRGLDPDFKGEELTFPSALGIVEELSFLRWVLC
jgi:Phosphatidylinositol-specific phospholipase C, Y domain